MSICVADCAVFYSPDDGEAALCRRPDFILWPPPKLQHVGNKPFSSDPQTVQQSMGNYVRDRWASLSISPSRCLSRCPLCILSPFSPSCRLLILPVSFFLLGSPLPPPQLDLHSLQHSLHLKCDSSAARSCEQTSPSPSESVRAAGPARLANEMNLTFSPHPTPPPLPPTARATSSVCSPSPQRCLQWLQKIALVGRIVFAAMVTTGQTRTGRFSPVAVH